MSQAKKQELQEKTAQHSSQIIYQGKVIQFSLESYHIDGKKKTFERIHHPGAVVIIPINQDGRLLLVQQWRRAINRITTELPAGTLEKDEIPFACAERELQEEIGYRAQQMTPLNGFFCAPGFCDEYLHLFLGENLVYSPLPADEDEGIDVISLSLDEAISWIEQEKIIDAKSIAGILRYAVCRKRC
jgi:ADP-ribose pyrophosphatase